MRMGATGGDAWVGVSDDLTQVLRGDGTALVGGIGIVVERHEAVLRDNGFGSCYSFFVPLFFFPFYQSYISNFETYVSKLKTYISNL